ncbi:MAG TPA: glycosyltransferase family 4 protein [Candidatus Nanopelagicaceae bacterium]|nr:glycosyltransferase family 4 protein [Candidatus Nanopelagicaceae bacterium]
MTRTLVVTNDFGPRTGGIESFVNALVERAPRDSIVVHAGRQEGDEEYDEDLRARTGVQVIRDPMRMLLPSPGLASRTAKTARDFECTSVWFGAAAPLGLLTPTLRRVGITRAVATTHGHEVWWARTPVTRQLLHRVGEVTDVVTYLGEYTRSRVGMALSPSARMRMAQLTPGVDEKFFRPNLEVEALRQSLDMKDRRLIMTVGRLVPRKGQDRLIEALPEIRKRISDVGLVVVGEGPYRTRLEAKVRDLNLSDHVRMVGRVPLAELPTYLNAAQVFAMPSRSRLGGLEVEGLGIVYLEASACAIPVIAGNSGGAPDAVREGITGFVVDGRDRGDLVDRIVTILGDEALASRMGAAGREFVLSNWRWDDIVKRHQLLLHSE